MKRSLYTVDVCAPAGCPQGDRLLLNTATGAFAQVNGEVFDCLQKGEGAFAGWLEDAGFLVPREEDELAAQQRMFNAARRDGSMLALALAPTYACNCRCVYCYEQDKATAKNTMKPQVEQALYRFVEQQLQAGAFEEVFVEWYGGDPSLCLDVVERISVRLMDLCAQRGLRYHAMMLSNCVRIGGQEAALLARCKVESMLVTLDGTHDMHNARRPAVGEADPFARIMESIRCLQAQGIEVSAMSNLDKVNAQVFSQLSEQLQREFGIALAPAKLNDYAHSYGHAPFSAPNFSLFTHEEFAHECHRLREAAGFMREELAETLGPCRRFCLGQLESYYVVDALGDVYKCDGWMGDRSRALFNLMEDEPVTNAVSYDPFGEERCRMCSLLPLCWGNCSWEQERTGWPCHPLKYTMPQYLASYRACFGEADGPATLFVAGRRLA